MDGHLPSPGSEATDYDNHNDCIGDLSQSGLGDDFPSNNPFPFVFDEVPIDVDAPLGGGPHNDDGSGEEWPFPEWVNFSPGLCYSNERQNEHLYPMLSNAEGDGDVSSLPLPTQCPQSPKNFELKDYQQFISTLPPRNNTLLNSVAVDPVHLALRLDDFTSNPATETISSQMKGVPFSPPSHPISTIDNGSIHSDNSTACSHCQKYYRPRELPRHMKNVHPKDDDPWYGCKCRYRVSRKDNYKRHLNRTDCKARDDFYTCICQQTQNDKKAHQLHIENCSRKRAGRPRNSTRSVQ